MLARSVTRGIARIPSVHRMLYTAARCRRARLGGHAEFRRGHLVTARVRSALGVRSLYVSASQESELRRLEEQAERAPNDPVPQARFLEAANRAGLHKLVVERFQKVSYAYDDDCSEQYIYALSRTDGLQGLSVSQLYEGSVESSGSHQGRRHQSPDRYYAGAGMENLSRIKVDQDGTIVFRDADYNKKTKNSFLKSVGIACLTVGLVYLAYRGVGNSLNPAAQLKPSYSEVSPESGLSVTFDDVKGCDEAKQELEEVVAFLRDPARFTRLGGKLPKGVLLTGPPGTGKTLLAKAVAGEAGVPFFYASASEFEEMFVGLGAKRVRELFEAAKAKTPCIIFIDEIDAIGGKRKMRDHSATRQTLNQLLVELDGFMGEEGATPIIIAATNTPELLDKALTRPGRFDRHVIVGVPDLNGRKEILDLYGQRVEMADDVDTRVLARGTPGCSGADLFNLVNSAAIKASLENRNAITMKDLEYAKDKILMGAERVSHRMTEDDRKLTAYHEGGHAIVAINTKGAYPIHKATIMPRGQALGMVHQLPLDDRDSATYAQLRAQLDVCMGGRVAEEMIFGAENITTGASSDFKQATRIARQMVMVWGMGETGILSLDKDDLQTLSPETLQQIDREVKKITSGAYDRAKNLLTRRQKDLHTLAQGLLKYETLNSKEIMEVIAGKELQRDLTHDVPRTPTHLTGDGR